MTIGVTGGIGSGKTTVCKILKEKFQAHVFVADEYGRETLNKENPCYSLIVEKFGESIIDGNGDLSNQKLANIVYSNPSKLTELNNIVHPYVWRRIMNEKSNYVNHELIVIESAILLEAGYGKICDEVWGVICNVKLRKKRLIESRGYSMEKVDSIMNSQMNQKELSQKCHKIIQNDGNLLDLEKQLKNIYAH